MLKSKTITIEVVCCSVCQIEAPPPVTHKIALYKNKDWYCDLHRPTRNKLSPRYAYIYLQRKQGRPFTSLAKELNISAPRVRQIYNAAVIRFNALSDADKIKWAKSGKDYSA